MLGFYRMKQKSSRCNEDSAIVIAGIEDPLSSYLDDDEAVEASMNRAFEDVPDDMFKLLLSHRPEQFEVYVERGIDVVFSGHAHGGQFRIPGLGGLVAPGQGFFPTYTSGIYNKGDSRMVVSRGLGNSIIPIRIFNRPEIVVVTLQNEESIRKNAKSIMLLAFFLVKEPHFYPCVYNYEKCESVNAFMI